MSIIHSINNAFKVKQERNWDKIYFAIDIHGTILKSTHNAKDISKEYYPYAIETLQELTNRKDIILILTTSSYDTDIEQYLLLFKQNGIIFDYINCNPEVKSTDFGCFDKKYYFNVFIDDKAGFDAETEWIDVLKTIKQNNKILSYPTDWSQDRTIYDNIILIKSKSESGCKGCYFVINNNCNHPAGLKSGINSDVLRGCNNGYIWKKDFISIVAKYQEKVIGFTYDKEILSYYLYPMNWEQGMDLKLTVFISTAKYYLEKIQQKTISEIDLKNFKSYLILVEQEKFKYRNEINFEKPETLLNYYLIKNIFKNLNKCFILENTIKNT